MSRLKELDAYLTREMDDAAADAFEEALFDAPDDADLAFVDIVATRGADLARDHAFDMGITYEQIDGLIARGKRVAIMNAGPPGTTRTLQMRRDAELVATRMEINRPDLDFVDVEIYIVEHDVTKVLRDCSVNKTDGALMGICERPLAEIARLAGPTITKVRVKDGPRTVIGEWRLDCVLVDAPA